MPTFCRHNRLVENCPICSKSASRVSSSPARAVPRRESRPAGVRSARAPKRSVSGGMTVRRLARAEDDGYENDLVPGLRASEDARRLADELAFSAARLRQLDIDPPGLYGEVKRSEDREEAAWLTFLIAFLSPLEGTEDPFSGIQAVRTTWASGEIPDLEGAQTGPRTAFDPKRGTAALVAYRAWAQRGGGQIASLAGEESWTLQHRYDRGYERLGMPGFGRPNRVEFLTLAHHLGLVELDPWTLHLSTAAALDPVAIAAKRILGIGDPVLLQRRQREVAHAAGVPVEALDLGFYNWAAPSPEARVTAGCTAMADAAERERIAGSFGL
ncbi:hypothetical protein FSW04_22070 [Baekduia soli]|uniref:Uncharacterized protein n=1 Tax=Baekduia soli TaxID=496014 RepID=A0A5B8UAZ7_9ACTN|nr:hypothetical protein [Baekduia soli]QEC49988.1 hypothetical protein FSW04_22070 [Baekduia soli]